MFTNSFNPTAVIVFLSYLAVHIVKNTFGWESESYCVIIKGKLGCTLCMHQPLSEMIVLFYINDLGNTLPHIFRAYNNTYNIISSTNTAVD